MDDELKNGDVVRLKSGGPEMTIEKIDQWGMIPETKAMCQWFEGKGLKSELFPLHSLVKVK